MGTVIYLSEGQLSKASAQAQNVDYGRTALVLGVFIPIVQATTGSANEVRNRVLVDVFIADAATDAEVEVWPPDGVEHSLAAQVLQGLADEVAWERTAGGPAVRVGKRALSDA